MARMIRKQVYIEARQEEVLKKAASRLGTSEAELIRQAIDRLSRELPEKALDDQAWEEELAFMKERARLLVPRPARRWTRDELYGR